MKKIFIFIIPLILFCAIGGYLLTNKDINNNKKDSQKENENTFILNGNWIADGTQSRAVIGMNEDGTYIYADDYSIPYDLTIYADGTYYANFHNKLKEEKGTYTIKKDNLSFHPDNYPDRMMWHCRIKSNSEITDCLYAASYTKVD